MRIMLAAGRDAKARGLDVVTCVFSPSQELDRRGININVVRARLAKLGEIVAAAPSVRTDGSMQFEFTIAVRERPANLADWNTDGLVFTPTAGDSTVAPPPHERPETAPSSGAASLFISPSHLVRVDLSRLDDLMRITGEMVIHRSRLEERIARGELTGLQEINLALGRSLRELREALTRVRLVSVAEIFTRMPFVVNDLARDTGKRVRLVLEGQHTEIDKYLVERLKEPLLHLVRNAISHGIEPPAARIAAGKPEEATLTLRAEAASHSVIISVVDDGRGVDRESVVAHALAAGLPVSEAPDNHELLDILCRQGFSTRDEADRASGRGVGMAVVQNTVRELGGGLSLETTPGRGTRFTLRLPLTLSIAETFIVRADEHTCAIPQEFVQEVLQIEPDQFHLIHQREAVTYRDGVLPVLKLRALFDAEDIGRSHAPALVLGTDRGLVGLVVDRVVGKREVVVRSIQDPLVQVPCVSGATKLGDGRPVLILDPNALAARLSRAAPRISRTPSSSACSLP
jgi:two-component system chemotaxis sensor kinase CheA